MRIRASGSASVAVSIWLGIAALTLETGCANVSTAPAEQGQAAMSFEASPDKGVVYLYRPGRAIGAALQETVKINGMDAGGTGPGTFFRWELKPGTYVFSSFTRESSAAVSVVVAARQLYFIEQMPRMGLTEGGRVTLREVDAATGKRAVQGLKLLVSTYFPEE